jgi:hypothetical protein
MAGVGTCSQTLRTDWSMVCHVISGSRIGKSELSHLQAGLSLPTGQPIEHLEPWFFAAITFLLAPLLEDVRTLSNDR